MYYSSITASDAIELASTFKFEGLARAFASSLKSDGYATDNEALEVFLVPAVFRDRISGGYFAGYLVTDAFGDPAVHTKNQHVDGSALHSDPKSAALAADRLADDAAQIMRVARPVVSDARYHVVRRREHMPSLRNSALASCVRASCADKAISVRA